MCQLVRDPLIVCMRQNSQVVKRKSLCRPSRWCDKRGWKKFGVTADKLVDLLGLMGDSIDDIPGAPGIGSKARCRSFSSSVRLKPRWRVGNQSNTRRIASRCATTPT